MQVTSLNHAWRFRSHDQGPGFHQPNVHYIGWHPAQVPGHVHLDLQRAGILPDVFHASFEYGAQWVDQTEWTYETTFVWEPKKDCPHRVLRFEGLDTLCTIYLNDALLATHENMFVPLEVDVTQLLKTGENHLRVEFASSVVEGGKRRQAYFEAEGMTHEIDNFDERAFIRKAQYMYAWDWGPRFVSCGIWQPVQLLEFAGRIKSVVWNREREANGSFRVTPTAEVEGEGEISFNLNGETHGANEPFTVQAELWWPHGYGAQPLYEAVASLSTGHAVTKKIGFRTISLLREKDSFGESFRFEVNGRSIYARGANWIPNDSFPSRVSPANYVAQVSVAKSLNMNMLRVWGGGLYELDAFYDACDEAGILVWQDFPFACSYYPDGPDMQAQVGIEAQSNIHRLMDRTSLALWCGNNENLTMWEGKWGDKERQPSRYYGENLYDHVLPNLLAEMDPHRPYIASSPIGGPDANADNFGDQHYWNVWHGAGDWQFYSDSKARFCSEFGFASGCLPDLWKSTLDNLTLAGSEHLSHDKTNKPWPTFHGYVDLHYPVSTTLMEWTVRSQLNQRDALRYGIEHYRRWKGCDGALIWQLNDCWPVQSWAVQDYNRNLKVAGWELARLYAPLLLTVVQEEEVATVWLTNDTSGTVSDTLVIRIVSSEDGRDLHYVRSTFVAEISDRIQVGTVDLKPFEKNAAALSVVVEGHPETLRWSLLGEPKDLNAKAISLKKVADTEYEVKGFVRDLIAWQGDQWLESTSHRTNSVTACNETVTYKLKTDEPVRFLSLAGDHPIV